MSVKLQHEFGEDILTVAAQHTTGNLCQQLDRAGPGLVLAPVYFTS